MLWVAVLLGVGLTVPFVALTVAGARRRGNAMPKALLAGLLFPVAWVAWYVVDERPYRRRSGPVRGSSL